MNSQLPADHTALELSRRIDWRFLLPSLRLESVAVLGPADAGLVEALDRFAGSFTRLPDPVDPNGRLYDLVVVMQPDRRSLRQAAALCGPGSVLYAEVNRRRLPARAWLRHPTWYRTVLAQLGFGAVQTYWHWPDFTRCKLISPLFDRGAVALALRRRSDTVSARLQAHAGQLALSAGILPRLIPCFSLVAVCENGEKR
jgi:hypothetical protein